MKKKREGVEPREPREKSKKRAQKIHQKARKLVFVAIYQIK